MPEFIFNLDETMLNVGQNKSKVIVFKDELPPIREKIGMLEHITLLFGISATGESLKPLVILPLLTVPDLGIEIHRNYDITGNDSGWITGPILKNWLQNQFVYQINQLRLEHGYEAPVLILMDNHKSRISIDSNYMWEMHHIAFLFIPPHSSHLLQPLDRCPNGEFKIFLAKTFKPKDHESANEKRNRVLRAAIPAYKTALSSYYVLAGWAETGLEPYMPSRVLMSGKVLDIPAISETNPEEPQKKRGKRFDSKILSNGVFFPDEIKEYSEV